MNRITRWLLRHQIRQLHIYYRNLMDRLEMADEAWRQQGHADGQEHIDAVAAGTELQGATVCLATLGILPDTEQE